MKHWKLIVLLASFGLDISPVHAQFSNSYELLKAVREKDGAAAQHAITATGGSIINARDPDSGDTSLLIAVKRSDLSWMGFLLGAGANPNSKDGAGNSPLIISTNANFREGVTLLLSQGADINQVNDSGETALMKAVQTRQEGMVRALLDAGARVDITDSTAGLSALDYAERDKRLAHIAQVLKDASKKK